MAGKWIREGSGSSANPWPSTDVSKEGRSPNENKTASRAPAASITAVSTVLAVWRKLRSAVSSGPKPANASSVLKIFLKLAPGNASCGGTCEKPELNQVSIAATTQLLVSLVRGIWPRFGFVVDDHAFDHKKQLRVSKKYAQGHTLRHMLDTRPALAHTSAKSPALLAFCRICPETYRLRVICGCASIQAVSLRENTRN
jgi:hypothetical protein